MSKHKSPLAGIVVGLILIVIPEPSTTILGAGIVAYSAYKAGWFGKP